MLGLNKYIAELIFPNPQKHSYLFFLYDDLIYKLMSEFHPIFFSKFSEFTLVLLFHFADHIISIGSFSKMDKLVLYFLPPKFKSCYFFSYIMEDIFECFLIFWSFECFSKYCLFKFSFLADIIRKSNEFFFELIFSMESCNSSLRFLMVMNKFLCMSENIYENWSHSLMKFEFRYFRIDTEKMLCNLIFFSSSAYEIYGFFLGLI